MIKELETPLLILFSVGGLILGFLLGLFYRASEARKAFRMDEAWRKSYNDLSQELAKTREELKRKREISMKIPIIVRRMSERLVADTIPAIAVRFTIEFFHATQVGYFAPANDEETFTLIEGVGFPSDWKRNIRVSSKGGILGMAVQNMAVILRDEYLASRGEFPAGPDSLEKKGVVADLVAPIVAFSKTVGVLVIAGSSVRIIEERNYASMLADLIANATHIATKFETVELSASVDPLTKVSNRRHFVQWFDNELRRAKNYTQPLSLLMLDIDHFKKVNDTYGHPVGDKVLMKIGQILRASTRSSDLCARYGGEEFAVLITSSAREQAITYAENLRKAISEADVTVAELDAPIKVTISGGLATFPRDGLSTAELIRAADEALYLAKQQGRNRIVPAEKFGLDGKPIE